MTMNITLPVGRIEGLVLQRSASADPTTHQVAIQYTGRTPPHALHELQVPLLDALNLPEQMSKDAGFEHLRRPPGTARQ